MVRSGHCTYIVNIGRHSWSQTCITGRRGICELRPFDWLLPGFCAGPPKKADAAQAEAKVHRWADEGGRIFMHVLLDVAPVASGSCVVAANY